MCKFPYKNSLSLNDLDRESWEINTPMRQMCYKTLPFGVVYYPGGCIDLAQIKLAARKNDCIDTSVTQQVFEDCDCDCLSQAGQKVTFGNMIWDVKLNKV